MSARLRRPALAVIALTLGLAAGAAAQPAATSDAIQALQKQILADPKLAGRVHSLSDNQQVRDALADPAVSDALNRGDFGALLANPKIQRLADDPAVQNLTRDLNPSPD